MTAAVERRQPRIEDRGIAGGVLKNEQQVKIEVQPSRTIVVTCQSGGAGVTMETMVALAAF